MNIKQLNDAILITDFLDQQGILPAFKRGVDWWYISPVRETEHTPSFKVNTKINRWYDHGSGEGGKLFDLALRIYKTNDAKTVLQKLTEGAPVSSFHKQKPHFEIRENTDEDGLIQILAVRPISDNILCQYLQQRKIPLEIANQLCKELQYESHSKMYTAIGFHNSAGGYELRNKYFKGSSSPKYVTYLDNKANTITVFEGFFDFLSYQTIHQNQEQALTNFLVLNSLAFFERSLLLMEKHHRIHLYLDHDTAGRKYNSLALKRSEKFHDESRLYKGYKDLNEWVMNFGKTIRQKHSLNILS